MAQLHGDGARVALFDLPDRLDAIYVLHAQTDGSVQTPLPAALAAQHGKQLSRRVDWVLVDGMQARDAQQPSRFA